MENTPQPADLGVPHQSWRPNQFAMYQKVADLDKRGGGFIFGELGTGSGKSAVACAMGHQTPVLVVCHTLALLSQYETRYGFSVIRGRQEYLCVNSKKISRWKRKYRITPLASDCHFEPMHKCPASDNCPYLLAKHEALSARLAACTYRYIGVSALMRLRAGNIVLDEAHDAAEELVRFNTFEVSFERIRDLKLPIFPIPTYGPDGKGDVITDTTRNNIQAWINTCMWNLTFASTRDDKAGTIARRTARRFTRMLEDLYTTDWFLEVAHDRVILRALDAIKIANKVFAHKHTKLLMSATIGDPAPLASALGILDYEFHTFPHPVPPQFRMIKDLRLPRMTKENLTQNPQYPYEQVQSLWAWIQNFPPEWRGVILTTSYRKIEVLHRCLESLAQTPPLVRRLIVQHAGEKVNTVVNQFITDKRPGDIMIGTIQGMGSGIDLYGDLARWIVIAGVPFPVPTDRYEIARRCKTGLEYERWLVYSQVVQACGRISRAEQDGNGSWLPNYAALADGSAITKTALRYYGNWFKEALV